MKELSSEHVKVITNGHTRAGHVPTRISHLKGALEKWVRSAAVFIIYGPGVLGFLWLIGRFLKR